MVQYLGSPVEMAEVMAFIVGGISWSPQEKWMTHLGWNHGKNNESKCSSHVIPPVFFSSLLLKD